MKEKIVLALLPYWNPLIPPMGLVCLKSYLAINGVEAKIVDANVEPGFQEVIDRYFNTLKSAIPQKKQGNLYNLGNEILRHHLMAHFRSRDRDRRLELVRQLVEQTFFTQLNAEPIVELNTLVEEFYKRLHRYIEELLESEKPSVLGISTYTVTLPATLYAFRLAKIINPNIKTIIGGGIFTGEMDIRSPNFHYFSEETPFIDKIIVGEGELLFLEYLRGNLPSGQRVYTLADIQGQTLDLAQAPLLDFSGLQTQFYPTLASYTSRSCPYNCSFCSEKVYWGKYRRKNGKLIVQQMAQLMEKYKTQLFLMADSLLNPVVDDIAAEVTERGYSLYWDGYLRAESVVGNPEKTARWRAGGFYRARLGLESGSPKILKAMGKRITPDQIKQAVSALAKAGIKTTTYWVIGYPGETEDDFQQTLDLITAMKYDIYEADCNPFIYYLTGQVESDLWANEKKARPLYPLETRDMLMLQDWVLDTPPSREETFSRLNRFVQHCQELGIPNPYRLIEIYEADKRWEKLHPNSPPGLADFINAKNSRKLTIQEETNKKNSGLYWRKIFSTGYSRTVFPYDFENKINGNKSRQRAMIPIRLEGTLYETLVKVSNRSDVRLHILLTAGWLVLLNKYTGNRDITVGIPANQTSTEGRERNNLLPLKSTVTNDMSVKELLLQIGKLVLEANQNKEYSFEDLLEGLQLPRKPRENPFLDLLICLEEIHNQPDLKEIPLNMEAKFRKSNEAIGGELIFNPEVYRKLTIETILSQYNYILESMFQDVNKPLLQVEIMSYSEKQRLLEEFSCPDTDISPDENILGNIINQAVQHPNTIALVGETLNSPGKENAITFRELIIRTAEITALLMEKNVLSESIVAIMMERTIDMVAAILGVWGTGAAYLPIEPSNPSERIEYMVKDSGALIVLSGDNLPKEKTFSSTSVPSVYSVANFLIKPGSLAYVIYTSGSTGQPKGAMVEHRGMMNHLNAKIKTLEITSQSIIAQESPHTFDISVWQFFSALNQGGRTIIYPGALLLEPHRFLHRLGQHQVTILEVVPSYLAAMLEVVHRQEKKILLSVKYLLVTGEEIKPHLVADWFNCFPTVKMINAYGPTEASDDITHHIMDAATFLPGTVRIPIGKPILNLSIYIIDEQKKLAPVGIPGEILVTGIGVGRGYLNNPEMTATKFECSLLCKGFCGGSGGNFFKKSPLAVGDRIYKTGDIGRWLPNGEIEFFGRKDYQVKIRGFRIELGEIENHLRNHPKVKDAIVIDRQDKNMQKYLCAYIIGEVTPEQLKTFLIQLLPEYMVPSYFVIVDSYPLTPNGKIDRKAMPEPQTEKTKNHLYISTQMLRLAQSQQIEKEIQPFQEENVQTPQLSTEEMQKILYSFNDTESEYPVNKGICQIFLEQALKKPDRKAVVGMEPGGSFRENRPPAPPAKAFERRKNNEIHLTYREMERWVVSIAVVLKERGVESEAVVGILVERTPAMIAGMLAIMAAGAVYLALSPTYPAKRTALMCNDSGMKLALVDRPHTLPVADTLNVNKRSELENPSSEIHLMYNSNTKSAAAIFFTSGSTGSPKGVILHHRGLVNRLYWLNQHYPFGENGVFLQKTSVLFDVSMGELFGWSLCGGTVYLMPPNQESNNAVLAEIVSRGRVTHIHFIPAALVPFLHYFETTGETQLLKSLNYVFASGEELTREMVNRFNHIINSKVGATLHNLYGPTEASIEVSYYDCPVNTPKSMIPIGKPIANTRLFILGPDMKLLPIGEAGQLCIGGVGVARGYLNHPELTAEMFCFWQPGGTFFTNTIQKCAKKTNFCFKPGTFVNSEAPSLIGWGCHPLFEKTDPLDPPRENDLKNDSPTFPLNHSTIYKTGDLARWLLDGNIQFLGRMDRQIQVNGIRVEPGEIESVFLKQPGLKAVAVVPRKESNDRIFLCAFIETLGNVDVSLLKKNLAKEMPPYMLPAQLVEVERLPLTSGGKLDRKVLETIDLKIEKVSVGVEPRNQKENQIATIWKEVLNKDNIGIHDNFFDKGGNSLGIIQVNVRMKEVFQREIPALILFEYSTIAALAQYMEQIEQKERQNLQKVGIGATNASELDNGIQQPDTEGREEIKIQGRQRMQLRRSNIGQKSRS